MTTHHCNTGVSTGFGITRNRHTSHGTTSPYTPYTYAITQPSDNPDATQRETGGYDVLNPSHFDAVSATIAFYTPETLGDTEREFRDDQSHERVKTITDFETDKQNCSNKGHVITTEINIGDTFYFTTCSQLYEYVGVTKTTGDYPEKLVFAPVNEAVTKTRTELTDIGPDKTRDYLTRFKSDFAHKFAPYKTRSDSNEILHILRLNTAQYDIDLATITSLHDIPAKPTPSLTVTPTINTGVIESGKTLLKSLWESVKAFRAADPPITNTPTPGVIAHTPHTIHDGEFSANTHSIVYQSQETQ